MTYKQILQYATDGIMWHIHKVQEAKSKGLKSADEQLAKLRQKYEEIREKFYEQDLPDLF